MWRYVIAGLISCGVTLAQADSIWQASVRNPHWRGSTVLAESGVLLWGTDARLWHRLPQGVWQDAFAPHDSTINGVLPLNSHQLWAYGEDGLLLESRDAGQTWRADAAPQGQSVYAMAASQNMVLLIGKGFVMRATLHTLEQSKPDWQALTPQQQLIRLQALDERRWAAIDHQGEVWITHNDGDSWQQLPAPTSGKQKRATQQPIRVHAEALAYEGGQLLVGWGDGSIYSTDVQAMQAASPSNANIWRFLHRNQKSAQLRQIEVTTAQSSSAPGRDVLSYGSAGACAWQSKTTKVWRDCSIANERGFIAKIAVSDDGRQWVAVGEAGLSYTSFNQGKSWKRVRYQTERPGQAQVDKRVLSTVQWDRDRRGFVAAGEGGVIVFSSTATTPKNLKEATTQPWITEYTGAQHYAHDLVEAPGGGLLVAMTHRRMARSIDAGQTWRTNAFEKLREMVYFYSAYKDNEAVVAAGSGGALYAPDGKQWVAMDLVPEHIIHGIAPYPKGQLALLYGTLGVVIQFNMRTAQAQVVKLPDTETFYLSQTLPSGRVYLFGEQGKVVQSGDGGQTWRSHPLPDKSKLLVSGQAINGEAVLTAGRGNVLWRMTLNEQGEPQGLDRIILPVSAAWDFIAADAAGRQIWMGGDKGILLTSADHGKTWQLVETGVQTLLRQPSYDAQRRRWWMPGRNGVLLISVDDGQSWQRVNTGTKEPLKGVWIDPQDGSVLAYGARFIKITAQ